ncbi:MAG: DUF2513 domain-containing protein [Verrucomicrobiia bacterium]
MKMDLNLIRQMLLAMEAHPAGQPIYSFKFDGKENAEILEHVQLLHDAGFIEATIVDGNMGEPVECMIRRMTFAGQQFLANAKNDTIWKKVLTQAEEKGISSSMVVINGLLVAAAKKYANLD